MRLAKHYRVLDYDVEIQDDPNELGWSQKHLFKVSTIAYTVMVVAPDFSLHAFYQNVLHVDDIQHFVEEVKKSDVITGWNIQTFDNVVMNKYFEDDLFGQKSIFDLMAVVRTLTGVMFKLDNVGATLGIPKLDDGAAGKSIKLWESAQQGNSKDMYRLLRYNLGDTTIDSVFLQKMFLSQPNTPFKIVKENKAKGDIRKEFDLYKMKQAFADCVTTSKQSQLLT